MFVPLLLLGGLGANWQACKELDEVASYERSRRPLSDFWGGVLLGGILGLWVGLNYGDGMRLAYDRCERVLSWITPALRPILGSGQEDKRPPQPPAPGMMPPAQGMPMPMQVMHPGAQQPGMVYYQMPQQ
eukprot:TRINITY_DN40516_c0_g1_i1.p1 TRINITY_DN40516_c0_g1~~TRINITY_DN40516_c0_g1_i1.p1  ORF type:complete len:130 (-),score=23.91 TRINITY_DN40516_c0_g1_i1:113-502(-)